MTQTPETEALVADGCLGIDDAAAFAGVSRATVYALMADGQLTYAQVGRRRLVTRRSLRAWLAARVVARPAAEPNPRTP